MTDRLNRDKIILSMFLDEKLSPKEISDETGFSEYTIKKIIKNNGYSLLGNIKKKVEKKPNPKLNYIDKNHVIYNDKVYEVLSYAKAERILRKELGIPKED